MHAAECLLTHKSGARTRYGEGKDFELLQFQAVEQFADDDKTVVKKLIDAFIVKKQLQQMAS